MNPKNMILVTVPALSLAGAISAGSAEAQSNPNWADLTTLTAITLDLRVTSCIDSNRILMGGSGPRYYIDTVATGGATSRQWVSVPENLFQAGQVNTLGFRPAGVTTLGDLKNIRLGVLNADICIDRIELIANDHVVADWTYQGGEALIGSRYPTTESWLDITSDQLRPVLYRNGYPPDGTALCELPSGISSAALRRTIQGILGNSVYGSSGQVTESESGRMTVRWADYHPDDWTSLSGTDAGTIHVDTRFHAGTNWTSGAFGVDADVAVRMEFDITPMCQDIDPNEGVNNALGLAVSPIRVTEVSGSDFIVDAVVGIVSPEGQIGATVNARLDEVRASLAAVVQNLPLCPPITVTADGGLATNIDPFLLELARSQGLNPSLCR